MRHCVKTLMFFFTVPYFDVKKQWFSISYTKFPCFNSSFEQLQISPPLFISNCTEEKPHRSLRSRETDSDRQNRGLTLHSVSITLNSLHIIRHRPGTGDRQRAPVTSLLRRASFSAAYTKQCERWQAEVLPSSSGATAPSELWDITVWLDYFESK